MLDAATLTALRGQMRALMTDTCTLRRNLGEGPTGASAPDARGGFGDSRGGEQDGYRDDGPYPCRLQSVPAMRGEEVSGDKISQRSRFFLVLPWDVVVGNTDQVITAAGNNGTARTLEVLDTGGRTDGLTRRVSVMEIK